MASPSPHLRLLSAAAIVLAAAGALCVGACSLNPQPIPPGDTDQDATTTGPGGSGFTDDDGGSDQTGGGGTNSDAGNERLDGAADAPVAPPPDAGSDAADAGDGSVNLDAGDGGG